MSWLQLAGLIPAIIFPAASLAQLIAILRRHSAEGVSVATWLLVGVGNVALYLYNGIYTDVFNIAALLGAAVLNFCVAATAILFSEAHARGLIEKTRAKKSGARPDFLRLLLLLLQEPALIFSSR
jgi:uncharacterized protein with PQ loop repeat